ncbi:Heterokaryon incompatibility protein 6, OR allele [Madurella mycetomatis]|uniref:Heterokaryon incompatibility protein 6, OR allele n=1 Tax=Madurella mycetomatis TaxID=100816 RepID=A0A175VRT3_9PEZI|nr:Heterokaryon incompatibility protein 6, OR allele [Madurella mycetomatis]
MPPDIVLDRILNFKLSNPDYLNTPFWVDKLCINQEESEEKETAVHSMDLVYQYSGKRVPDADGNLRLIGCSLGLLFVEISTVDNLIMLRELLDSKFADFIDDQPTLLVSVEEASRVLDLVEMILSDNWWHRAWIFQEEFLASSSMILLLPCAIDRRGLGLENEEGVDLFGQTPGEIEVRPLNFRCCVTELCLALSRQADEAVRDRCSEILKHARRYTFLHRTERLSAGLNSVVHAMSPAIFEDIASRRITMPSDILAIAANCCRYVTRLDAEKLNRMGASLSVAILTLFLMNGEILRHDVQPGEIQGQTVVQGLRTAKLRIKSPVQSGELIFIKMCRLPAFTMTVDGFKVGGVLSRLDKKIKVKVSISDQEAYWKTKGEPVGVGLSQAEERLLLVLAAYLKSIRVEGGDALHTMLTAFVKNKDTALEL